MRTWYGIVFGLVCSAVSQVSLPHTLCAGELTEVEFRRLYRQLQPAPDEPWRTIPWKIALLNAQQTAAKEKKPIFIWAMDGHPLGCT